MKFLASAEIREFLGTLAPEPRRAVNAALRSIASGQARMEALHEPLERFYKVKSGKFRILCAVENNMVYALFVERRSVVYEIATAQVLEEMLQSLR